MMGQNLTYRKKPQSEPDEGQVGLVYPKKRHVEVQEDDGSMSQV